MTDTSESRPTEVGAPKIRDLSAKSKTRIGYWNALTLDDSSKFAHLNKDMENYKINKGRQDDIHRGCVAVILDKDANSALTEWTPVNE